MKKTTKPATNTRYLMLSNDGGHCICYSKDEVRELLEIAYAMEHLIDQYKVYEVGKELVVKVTPAKVCVV